MSIKTVITDVGFDLLRAAPGYRLVYTRAVCGSGSVENTKLTELIEVEDYVMDLSIVDVAPTATAATLRLQLDNSKAPREFQLYQIGIIAKLLDADGNEYKGDTLLQVMQYDQPDIVRAIPHVSEYLVNTLMGSADTVEGVIDLAAYVSIKHFQEKLLTLYTKAEIDAFLDDLNAQLANKANIGRPQMYELDYTEGYQIYTAGEYLGTYCKEESGLVSVFLAVEKNDKTQFSAMERHIVAQLPEGFRPQGVINTVGYTSQYGGVVYLSIISDGSIHIIPSIEADAALGTIVFNSY